MLKKGPTNLPEVSDASSGCQFTGEQVSGQAIVQTPDGVGFAMAGRFAEFSAVCEDRLIGVSNVSGAWSDDGELAVDWLGPTESNDWFLRVDDVDGWHSLQVMGGIDVLPETGGAVWTSGLHVDSDCPLEPVGEILVRGPTGWGRCTPSPCGPRASSSRSWPTTSGRTHPRTCG
ncbi:MAG: hypothetical protein GY913_12335 [Proteobacteria bacterium]|nr:hypothetical protein [Pseudomonadota bacterium]